MSRTILSLATAVIASLALATPAHAALTVTHDAKDDAKFRADFKKVTVDHTDKRVKLKSRVYPKKKRASLGHEVWHVVDTRGDRTPEFVVFVSLRNEVTEKPSVSITRIDSWPPKEKPYRALSNGDPVDCGLHVTHKRDSGQLLNTQIGRGCLKIDGDMPSRLRVNTFGTMEWGEYTDVVKGWKKYGRWVTAG